MGVGTGTAIAGVVSAIGSLVGGSLANHANANLNKSNMRWQEAMTKWNQNWQEKMWQKENEYNTPLAQRQRLQEAGYNPWISGSGGSMSNVSQGVPQTSSPSPPSMIPMQDVIGPAARSGVSAAMQQVQTQAQASNQLAQAAQNGVDTAIAIYEKTGDFDTAEAFLANVLSTVGGGKIDKNSLYFQQLNLAVHGKELDNANKQLQNQYQELQNQIQAKTGMPLAEATLYKIQQEGQLLGEEIFNVAKDTLLKGQQIDNLKEAKRLISEQVRESIAHQVAYYAEAYKLRKEGDKYVADTQTINQIRDSIVATAKNQANITYNQSWLQYYNSVEGKARFDQRQQSRSWLVSEEGQKNALGVTKLDNDRFFHAVDQSVKAVGPVVGSFFAPINGNGVRTEFGSTSESGTTQFGW